MIDSWENPDNQYNFRFGIQLIYTTYPYELQADTRKRRLIHWASCYGINEETAIAIWEDAESQFIPARTPFYDL